VQKPVAVRYAWADNPKGNIFNPDDVPLIPFRSDEWAYRKPEDLPVEKAPVTASATAKAKPKESGAQWGSFGGSSSVKDKPPTTMSAPQPQAAAAGHPAGKGGAPFQWPVAK
jgi:hypothetical protein